MTHHLICDHALVLTLQIVLNIGYAEGEAEVVMTRCAALSRCTFLSTINTDTSQSLHRLGLYQLAAVQR